MMTNQVGESLMSKSKARLSRRDLLTAAGGGMGAVIGLALLPRPASATPEQLKEVLTKMVGDKTPQDGRVTIELPEIAENGNTVPLSVSVESPMTEDDYVKSVHVFAEGNPNPDVASFHFTSRSGKAMVSTRMRLAKTQNVVAVAEMSDGSLYQAVREVKVTIGVCGG